MKVLLIFLVLFFAVGAYSQTFDYNLFEQGPLDTLVADSTSMVSDTVWFEGGQKGGFTIRGHLTKLTGDDKTLTL